MNQANARACRLCKAALDGGAALELRRVPRGAQYFPKSDERASDYSVNLDIYQCPYCGLIQLSGEPVIYGEGETSTWFGGRSTVYVVFPETESGEAVPLERITPREA